MTIREITDAKLQLLLDRMEAPEIEIPKLAPDGSNAEEVAALEEQKALQEQAFQDTLEMIHMDFADKTDGYCTVRAQVISDIGQVKAEKLRLGAIQSRLEKKLERLENAMLQAMQIMDMKNVKGALYTVSTRTSSAVQIDATSVYELPDDMVRYSDPVPDKVAIKAWLKNHPETEWAHMESTTSLIIK